jgi:hypothetical protein
MENRRFRICSTECKDGELILTADDPDNKSHYVYPQQAFFDISVTIAQMIKLKEKYGVRWDGSEESLKQLKGKIINYRMKNGHLVIF